MLTHIRNGQMAKRDFIYQKRVKNCENILRILWNDGFILGYEYDTTNPNCLKILLKYKPDGKPVINSIKLITKPNRRVYYSVKQIWKINVNSGLIIMSTNQGIMTISDCKKKHLGGEALVVVN